MTSTRSIDDAGKYASDKNSKGFRSKRSQGYEFVPFNRALIYSALICRSVDETCLDQVRT